MNKQDFGNEKGWRTDFLAVMLALVLCCGAGLYAEPHRELLWPDGAPSGDGFEGPERVRGCIGNFSVPTLTLHPPSAAKATGAAVIVMPGGGYGMVCVKQEGRATRAEAKEWGDRHEVSGPVGGHRL